MKFGKVDRVDAVDFTLPLSPPENEVMLQRIASSKPVNIYLACPQWSGFEGKLYPKNTKASDFLHHYSRQFNAIELNTTFYGVNRASLLKWSKMVPPEFKFCPKVPKDISHFRYLIGAEFATKSFCEDIAIFGHNLGPAFLLLPQNFTPVRFGDLMQYVAQFPSDTRLSIEVRNKEWFKPEWKHKLFALFEHYNIVSIITDVAGRRDVLHQRLTSDTVIIRFVGNRHHPTDFERLDAWGKQLEDWMGKGLKEVYFFLHQPEEHLNVEIAIHLANTLNQIDGVQITPPRPYIDPASQQTSLF